MSNATLAQRMLDVETRYEHGEISATALDDALTAHAAAVEGLPRSWHDELHSLTLRALEEDVTPLEAQLLGWERKQTAVPLLRAHISGLIDASTPDL